MMSGINRRSSGVPMRRLSGIAVVSALLVSMLSGCALLFSGPTREEIIEDIRQGILEEVPLATDALVSTYYSGVRSVYSVKVYLSEHPADEGTEALDQALRIIWTRTNFEPVNVEITLTVGDKPAAERESTSRVADDGIDLTTAVNELGFLGIDTERSRISLWPGGLEQRYGEWGRERLPRRE